MSDILENKLCLDQVMNGPLVEIVQEAKDIFLFPLFIDFHDKGRRFVESLDFRTILLFMSRPLHYPLIHCDFQITLGPSPVFQLPQESKKAGTSASSTSKIGTQAFCKIGTK